MAKTGSVCPREITWGQSVKYFQLLGVVIVFGALAMNTFFALRTNETLVDMSRKIEMIAAKDPQKEISMTSDTTTWKSAYGMKSLTTYKGAGETNEAWAARTLAEVKAMQIQFPIVP